MMESSELAKFSSCVVDLGLGAVEQEVKTKALEVDTERYLTYPTSRVTEVSKMLDQRMSSERKQNVTSREEKISFCVISAALRPET